MHQTHHLLKELWTLSNEDIYVKLTTLDVYLFIFNNTFPMVFAEFEQNHAILW